MGVGKDPIDKMALEQKHGKVERANHEGVWGKGISTEETISAKVLG